jgi:hypothetical protein
VLRLLVFLGLFAVIGTSLDRIKSIIDLFSIFLILSLLYAFFEVHFPKVFSPITDLLYKREWREVLDGVGITFFGTTYFAAFIYFSLFLIFYICALNGKGGRFYFFSFVSIILVLYANSKTFYVLLLFMFIFLPLAHGSPRMKLVFSVGSILLLIIFVSFVSIFFDFFS